MAWGKIIAILAALGLITGAGYSLYNTGLKRGIDISRVELADYQRQVSDLNRRLAEESAQVTERVITNYVTRRETIREVVYRNRDVVANVVPEQFLLSEGWIYAHNQAVAGQLIDVNIASDATPSIISDRRALERITDNYAIINEELDRFEALQQWVREQHEIRTNTSASTNSLRE